MLSESRIRVMIVDDHAIVREGIAEVLEQSGEFEVVGQAGDGAEAVDKVGELRPDVVIMDILMPGMDGIEACREIVGALSETRVLMLTASNRHEAIVQAVNAGATGYLQKFSGQGDAGCPRCGRLPKVSFGCRERRPGSWSRRWVASMARFLPMNWSG